MCHKVCRRSEGKAQEDIDFNEYSLFFFLFLIYKILFLEMEDGFW